MADPRVVLHDDADAAAPAATPAGQVATAGTVGVRMQRGGRLTVDVPADVAGAVPRAAELEAAIEEQLLEQGAAPVPGSARWLPAERVGGDVAVDVTARVDEGHPAAGDHPAPDGGAGIRLAAATVDDVPGWAAWTPRSLVVTAGEDPPPDPPRGVAQLHLQPPAVELHGRRDGVRGILRWHGEARGAWLLPDAEGAEQRIEVELAFRVADLAAAAGGFAELADGDLVAAALRSWPVDAWEVACEVRPGEPVEWFGALTHVAPPGSSGPDGSLVVAAASAGGGLDSLVELRVGEELLEVPARLHRGELEQLAAELLAAVDALAIDPDGLPLPMPFARVWGDPEDRHVDRGGVFPGLGDDAGVLDITEADVPGEPPAGDDADGDEHDDA